MGFMDFLKGFIKQEEEIEIEKVNFDSLDNWIRKKGNEIEIENEKLLMVVNENIENFVNELDEKISVLKEVDVDKIKSEDKIKLVVKENLDKYIDYIKKFKNNLSALEVKDFIKFIKQIDEIFEEFQKKSSMNFQKATILIGKELGAVRNCIGNFINNVKKIMDKNNNFVKKTKVINLIKERLEEKEKNDKLKFDIEKNVREYNGNIRNFENLIKSVEEKINKIKKSEEYIMKVKFKEENENKKEEIWREISNLKSLIDFKELSKIYHINEKDMEVVKAHKDNFLEAFRKDNGGKIIQLLDEANLVNNDIRKKWNSILEKKKELDNFVVDKDEIEEFDEEIRKNKNKVEDLKIEKVKERKRFEKFCDNNKEIVSEIVLELGNIGVELMN